MDDTDFDWKTAYGRLRAQHQRAVLQLQQLREVNSGLLATLEQINELPDDLGPNPPRLRPTYLA